MAIEAASGNGEALTAAPAGGQLTHRTRTSCRGRLALLLPTVDAPARPGPLHVGRSVVRSGADDDGSHTWDWVHAPGQLCRRSSEGKGSIQHMRRRCCFRDSEPSPSSQGSWLLLSPEGKAPAARSARTIAFRDAASDDPPSGVGWRPSVQGGSAHGCRTPTSSLDHDGQRTRGARLVAAARQRRRPPQRVCCTRGTTPSRAERRGPARGHQRGVDLGS